MSCTPKSLWVELLGAQTRFVGNRYRTRIVEAGQGPALLLLHGTGGHLENYARNIMPLSRRFRVIALDFLWHGFSQTDGFDPEIMPTLSDQILDLMEALDIERASIEGQSLGGWVAMDFALRHPERLSRLVLTTTMGFTPDPGRIEGYVEPDWSSNLESTLDVLSNPTFEKVRSRMARILADPSRLTEEAIRTRQAIYEQPALAEVQSRFTREYLGRGAVWKHVVTDALAARITAPTLVYWGDKNRTPPALGAHLARQLPNGCFHCAADTGHWAQFESAQEHNNMVEHFLLSDSPTPGTAAT